ncbi:hypothetical protein FA13DRAFT_1819539, partial [Coprinellus micaceus]
LVSSTISSPIPPFVPPLNADDDLTQFSRLPLSNLGSDSVGINAIYSSHPTRTLGNTVIAQYRVDISPKVEAQPTACRLYVRTLSVISLPFSTNRSIAPGQLCFTVRARADRDWGCRTYAYIGANRPADLTTGTLKELQGADFVARQPYEVSDLSEVGFVPLEKHVPLAICTLSGRVIYGNHEGHANSVLIVDYVV